MISQEIQHGIKTIVHSFLPDAQIFLFGSRSGNTFRQDSDYDLLIVTEETYPPKEKMNLESKICKTLTWSLNAPFDIILHSKDEVGRFRNSKGYIIYYALKEAVELL